MNKLSSEEREILEAFEKGKLKRSKKAANTQKRHQEYAEAMFKKDARLPESLSGHLPGSAGCTQVKGGGAAEAAGLANTPDDQALVLRTYARGY